jgi:DnaJ-class molecular chaperone
METDWYGVLGVGRDADDAAVKKAYRKLALQWHPDKNTSPDALDKFNKIREAYEVLTNPIKRKFYDLSTSQPQFAHDANAPHFFSSPQSGARSASAHTFARTQHQSFRFSPADARARSQKYFHERYGYHYPDGAAAGSGDAWASAHPQHQFPQDRNEAGQQQQQQRPNMSAQFTFTRQQRPSSFHGSPRARRHEYEREPPAGREAAWEPEVPPRREREEDYPQQHHPPQEHKQGQAWGEDEADYMQTSPPAAERRSPPAPSKQARESPAMGSPSARRRSRHSQPGSDREFLDPTSEPDREPDREGHRNSTIFKTLNVTLEDLYKGFQKRLKVTRTLEVAPGHQMSEPILLTIDGEPGWQSGTKVTFEGAGDSLLGHPAQDIVVVIEALPHRSFTRQGDDLAVLVRVPIFSALFGHTTDIETLDGVVTHVPVDAVTPDTVHVVRGKGMPRASGHGFGDLVVRFEITAPTCSNDIPPLLPAADPSDPPDWRYCTLKCSMCRQRYKEAENTDTACFRHHGKLVTASLASGEALSHWTCCSASKDARGCQLVGRHQCTSVQLQAAKSRAGVSALCRIAATANVYACARFLISCRDSEDLGRPAAIAAESGNFFAVLLFARAGVDMHEHGSTLKALRDAAQADQHLLPRILDILDSDPELVDILARVPGALKVVFARACRDLDVPVIFRMLAMPNVGPVRCGVTSGKELGTVLIRCAELNHVDCAKLLLRAGADPNFVPAGKPFSPLIAACSHKHEGMVALLLSSGADPNVHAPQVTDDGAAFAGSVAPLYAAALQSNANVLAHLLKAGCAIDWASRLDGRTPLHNACAQGHTGNIELLLFHGARTSLRDAGGKRPLDLALESGHGTAVELLVPAILQEALPSMAGLTVLKILYEYLKNTSKASTFFLQLKLDGPPSSPGTRQQVMGMLEDLRTHLLVLEEALRTLCDYSDGLNLNCKSSEQDYTSTVAGAIQCYDAWRQGESSSRSARTEAGKAALTSLVSAGCTVKAIMQEEFVTLSDTVGA